VFTYTCVTAYDYCFILALQTPIRVIPVANGDEWALAIMRTERDARTRGGPEGFEVLRKNIWLLYDNSSGVLLCSRGSGNGVYAGWPASGYGDGLAGRASAAVNGLACYICDGDG